MKHTIRVNTTIGGMEFNQEVEFKLNKELKKDFEKILERVITQVNNDLFNKIFKTGVRILYLDNRK